MKVFISWSGELAKDVALELKRFLRKMLKCEPPFVSAADIEAGVPWFERVGKELEGANVGVICLTREKLDSKWLHFEAGAIAKATTQARAIPLLIDLEQHEVEMPFSLLQCVKADPEGIWKLVVTVNHAMTEKLGEGELEELFKDLFPAFAQALRAAAARATARAHAANQQPVPKPTAEQMLTEALHHLRAIQLQLASSPPAWPSQLTPGAMNPMMAFMQMAQMFNSNAPYSLVPSGTLTNAHDDDEPPPEDDDDGPPFDFYDEPEPDDAD